MAWYLEYERPLGQTNKSITDLIDLDCLDNILHYQSAKRIAKDIAQKSKLQKPKLIWVEAIRPDK